MIDKNLQVIQTENAPTETNLHGKANTNGEGSLRKEYAEMTTQEMSFPVDGQMLEGKVENENGGYIQMSETMVANMDPQMQVQMIGEQQMNSVQMNGEGIMMMQSQANGEQFYSQDGAYMQMTSQEMGMNSQANGEMFQMQSQGFMIDGQMVQGQQFIGGDSSGQMGSQEMQIQNMGMVDMSMVGSGQYGEQVIQSEEGLVQGTATRYGETQILGMTAQGMNGAGIESQGMITQEMQIGMNGEMIQMQGMSMAGGGMSMQEMSMGMSGEQSIQMQEMSMQNMQSEGVIYLDGGVIQGDQLQMGEMSMGMSGEQSMQMQEMSMQNMQSEGVIYLEGGEIQGDQLQMGEMAMGVTSGEMNGQEIGFVEGGELQISEMSMQEVGFVEGGEIQMSGMSIQEVGFADGGELQEQQFQMSEVSMSEMPLEMNGQEMQMQEMCMQEMSTTGMSMTEVSMTEMPMNEMSMTEMPTIEMSMQEMPMTEMSMTEMSLKEMPMTEMSTTEMSMTEMSMTEMPMAETSMTEMSTTEMSMTEMLTTEMSMQQMPMTEMSMTEMSMKEMLMTEMSTTEMSTTETPTTEMSMQEMPMTEMSMTEMSMTEMSMTEMSTTEMSVTEMPMTETFTAEMSMAEMSMTEMPMTEMSMTEMLTTEISTTEMSTTEMSSTEIPTTEMLMTETSMTEMSTTEMSMQEMSMTEMSMAEMSTTEMSATEMPATEMPATEMSATEVSATEVSATEMSGTEMSGTEMSATEMSATEMSMQEMPTQGMSMQEMSIHEMPLETQESGILEGDEIQEEETQPSEMTVQEISLETQDELHVSTAEMKTQEIPLDVAAQETEIHETAIQEIQSEKISSAKEEEVKEIKLPSKEISEVKEIPVDTSAAKEQRTPVEENNENTIVSDVITIVQDTLAESTWSLDVIGTVGDSWSMEEIGAVEPTPQKEPKKIDEIVKTKDSEKTREDQQQPIKPAATSTVEDAEVVDSNTKKEETKSNATVNVREVVTEKVSCDHYVIIDQYRERINRLEREKEYLEGRYDELRKDKETAVISREDQFTMRDDHHHCCDIVKDYSSLIEYITSPRDVLSADHSDVRGCAHTHTCYLHDGKENLRTSTQMSADYEYYKSKCEQIKREKERLQRAYETEKRQKEDIEKEYQNETDEKAYLEERYQGMLDSINRFDETIRSLRRDNELLQNSLNDWAKSRAITQTLEMNSMVLEHDDEGADIAEYKRTIQALEKENREFRTLLNVLSKKNESQESLKNIELGLARENEFIELKRERVKLESNIKEMKRTNKHQQERIEEVRRESTAEITRLKEKQRKLERSLKDSEKITEEKDEEIANLRKRHSEEIQGMEIRLQTDLSSALFAKNQIKDLQNKIQRLEEDRSRLREELRTSSTSGKDRYGGIDAEYQDIEVVRQRYEDERRSKMRLASDMKYLLSDIMDLKERNQRLQEDFTRERMEIKGMIEKQANEITQEYLTQISKLQKSLIGETKRRQEAEAGRHGIFTTQDNSTGFISGQREMTSKTVPTSWGTSELQQQLTNEIRQREALEIENKKLLYKVNEILSGGGNNEKENAFENFKNKDTPWTRNEAKVTSRDKKESKLSQKELHSEIEDLQEKLEDLKKEAKRNKDLKRKNEELEEEITHVTRKRDELLAAQRNQTREVDYLSRTLDEVERRNRKLSDETERFTRKIQDIEDSFRQEKITLARNYENERARAVEEVTKLKEACERRLQVQTDTTRTLEEKIRNLEEQASANVHTQSLGGNITPLSNTGYSYGISGDSRSPTKHSHNDKLKQEVQSLEAMLRDVNKKHADDLRNLEIQKQRMTEEFQREKQSLERYFEKENESLQKRLRDVESSIRGEGGGGAGQIRPTEAVGGENDETYISNPGRQTPLSKGTEGDRHMAPIHLDSSGEGSAGYRGNVTENNSEKKYQEMQRRLNEEKKEILNRASTEKTKLEEEVRDAKEKLTSYRRLLEDEMDDLKRKHRKELDHLNEKLLKERAEFEERLRVDRNGSRPKMVISATKWGQYSLEEDNMVGRDEQRENGSRPKIGMPTTQSSQYGLDEDRMLGREEQRLKEELEKQMSALSSKFDKDKCQLQQEKRNLMETIHALTKEVNALKCEKRESKNCYKQEIEKLARLHDVEKMTILQRAARDKDEELSRIKDDYEERLSSERRKLQAIVDDFRRKMSLTERKIKDMEMEQKEERARYQQEKITAERSLVQSREELKITLEREYRQMLNDEKHKFEQTVKSLTKQISFLQEQRKEIQAKLLSSEFSGNSKINAEQVLRNRVVIQMEQEFLERAERERRPMEDKIKDLQQEISKLKREKTELKATLENEKQELEEELEKMQEDMRRKLSKAREEMDRRSDAIGKTLMANRVKSCLVCSEMSSHQSTQNDVRQYKDQINLMEQRNLTLKSKTERLERELRVMGDRLRTLETRNKDLETANREEWSINRNDMLRSNAGYLGESDYRGGNVDVALGSNLAGLRSDTRVFQPSYSPRLNNGQQQQSRMGSEQSYGDILERVRYTMHTTGSISDALGGTMAGNGGLSNAGFIGAGLRQSEPLVSGSFGETMVNSLGGGSNVAVSYPGNTRFSVSNAGDNSTAEVVGSTSYGGEESYQQTVQEQ